MKVYITFFIVFFINFAICQRSNLHKNMVYISGGTFEMGADNDQAFDDEYPKHRVTVSGFWMDKTEVTNAQFAAFVKATNYVTTAEKNIDWNEIQKQLPPKSKKPNDEDLLPSSLIFWFSKDENFWYWKIEKGANWKHPAGLNSDIFGKDNYPAIHISYDDAISYCNWAKKRLPTEAEWEFAARGGLKNNIYPWGNENVNIGKPKCNNWQGNFPNNNLVIDKFFRIAPVKSYKPNKYGLYDMAGNVWEWCSDWYDATYYSQTENIFLNPKGPEKGYDPEDKFAQKRSIRGGSFLCSENFCSGYRNSRRMKETPDSSMEHIGFRCVTDK